MLLRERRDQWEEDILIILFGWNRWSDRSTGVHPPFAYLVYLLQIFRSLIYLVHVISEGQGMPLSHSIHQTSPERLTRARGNDLPCVVRLLWTPLASLTAIILRLLPHGVFSSLYLPFSPVVSSDPKSRNPEPHLRLFCPSTGCQHLYLTNSFRSSPRKHCACRFSHFLGATMPWSPKDQTPTGYLWAGMEKQRGRPLWLGLSKGYIVHARRENRRLLATVKFQI